MVTIHTQISKQETKTKSKTTERPNIPALDLSRVHKLKDQIKEGNLRLYKMQAQVLAATNLEPGSKESTYVQELAKRSNALEDHISGLCMQLRTARAVADGPGGGSFEHWRKVQERQASEIEKSLQGAQSTQKLANALVDDATTLEAEAEMMVKQLRAQLTRGEFSEYKMAQKVHQAELATLEKELAEARRNGRNVSHILPRIKAVRNDMAVTTEAGSSESDSSSESEDEDLAYETLVPLRVGDRVKLICEAEDGFCTGDHGTIVEVDPTITYPYRIKGHVGDGYFKACDIVLVESKIKVTSCPLSPSIKNSALSAPVPSPYDDTPYTSRSTSPYKTLEDCPSDDFDLEKGKCARRASVASDDNISIFDKAKELTVTLNPLAC